MGVALHQGPQRKGQSKTLPALSSLQWLPCGGPGALGIVDVGLEGQQAHLCFPVRHRAAGTGLPWGRGQGQSPSSALVPGSCLLSRLLADSPADGGAVAVGPPCVVSDIKNLSANTLSSLAFSVALEEENEMPQRRARGTEK